MAESRATFAAGCFWSPEEHFRSVAGVTGATVGYTGGHQPDPTYHEVCTGDTGHAEAVLVTFDPDVVSYKELLEHFWAMHDPTTPNRQGLDVGSQYRSAVFVHDDEQRRAACRSRDEQQALLGDGPRIVTEITDAGVFWEAEDFHQGFLEKRRARFGFRNLNSASDACGQLLALADQGRHAAAQDRKPLVARLSLEIADVDLLEDHGDLEIDEHLVPGEA